MDSPDLLERWYRVYWTDLTHQNAEDRNSFLHEVVAAPEEGTAEMVTYLTRGQTSDLPS